MLPMLSRILVPCRLFGSLVSIASIANGFMLTGYVTVAQV